MRAAVLGRPIAHSLSPRLHRAAYAALGLDWTYEALDCGEAELPSLLAALGPDWAGLSLTMPLKQAVLPLLTTCSDLARKVAAANTVVLGKGVLGEGVRHGENTDVAGLVAALAEHGVTSVAKPVILGGGATARSALAAVQALGCVTPTLVVRSEPVETLAAAARLGVTPTIVAFGPEVLQDCDLLISTLPAGAGDAIAPYVRDVPALLDVVYDPWPTALARACGGVVISGALMLLHQAAVQVELMTGRSAPLEAMRAALP